MGPRERRARTFLAIWRTGVLLFGAFWAFLAEQAFESERHPTALFASKADAPSLLIPVVGCGLAFGFSYFVSWLVMSMIQVQDDEDRLMSSPARADQHQETRTTMLWDWRFYAALFSAWVLGPLAAIPCLLLDAPQPIVTITFLAASVGAFGATYVVLRRLRPRGA